MGLKVIYDRFSGRFMKISAPCQMRWFDTSPGQRTKRRSKTGSRSNCKQRRRNARAEGGSQERWAGRPKGHPINEKYIHLVQACIPLWFCHCNPFPIYCIYIYTQIYIYMGNLYKTWSKHNINTMVSTASTVENIVFRRLGRAQSLKSGLTLVMGNDANGTGQKPGNCRNWCYKSGIKVEVALSNWRWDRVSSPDAETCRTTESHWLPLSSPAASRDLCHKEFASQEQRCWNERDRGRRGEDGHWRGRAQGIRGIQDGDGCEGEESWRGRDTAGRSKCHSKNLKNGTRLGYIC